MSSPVLSCMQADQSIQGRPLFQILLHSIPFTCRSRPPQCTPAADGGCLPGSRAGISRSGRIAGRNAWSAGQPLMFCLRRAAPLTTQTPGPPTCTSATWRLMWMKRCSSGSLCALGPLPASRSCGPGTTTSGAVGATAALSPSWYPPACLRWAAVLVCCLCMRCAASGFALHCIACCK